MKTITCMHYIYIKIVLAVFFAVQASAAELSEAGIRSEMAKGFSDEFYFPYLPKSLLNAENRPQTTTIIVSNLKENAKESKLRYPVEGRSTVDEALKYWSIFRSLMLIGYLDVPGAEDLIQPYTEFPDVHLRANALDALAADGSEEAVRCLWGAFGYYEQQLPRKIIANPEKVVTAWAESALRALECLSTVGGASAEQKIKEGVKLLKTHAVSKRDLEQLDSLERSFQGDVKSQVETIKKRREYLIGLSKDLSE